MQQKEEITIDGNKNIVIAYKKANVSVPITIKPKVDTKDAITFCYGDPVLRKRTCNCRNCCRSHCNFVLSQNICIEIPVEISADAIVKEACISCNVPEDMYEEKK